MHIVEYRTSPHICLVGWGDLIDIAAQGAELIPPDAGHEYGSGDYIGTYFRCEECFTLLIVNAHLLVFMDAARSGIEGVDENKRTTLAGAETRHIRECTVQEGVRWGRDESQGGLVGEILGNRSAIVSHSAGRRPGCALRRHR